MRQLTPQDALPDVSGLTPDGAQESLSNLVKADRLALVWWHPQVLTPASCRTCSGAGKPIQTLLSIYEEGCDVIGLSYSDPERLKRYQEDIALVYPMLSVKRDAAVAHGTAKNSGEPWEGIPHRIAYLVNDKMEIINVYEVNDPQLFLRRVLEDVKNGPPPEKWETPKKPSLWKRLVG